MLVPPYEIRSRDAKEQALETLQRAGKTPQPTVRRVSILLLAQARLSKPASAEQVGPARKLVRKGRNRFARYEPPPLIAAEEVDPVARLVALPDLPRSGRPPDFSPSRAPHGRRGRLARH